MCAVQLEQLEKESLQHTQQKAERFWRKGHQLSRFADRSERDPFADASPTDKYATLGSESEDDMTPTGTPGLRFQGLEGFRLYKQD